MLSFNLPFTFKSIAWALQNVKSRLCNIHSDARLMSVEKVSISTRPLIVCKWGVKSTNTISSSIISPVWKNIRMPITTLVVFSWWLRLLKSALKVVSLLYSQLLEAGILSVSICNIFPFILSFAIELLIRAIRSSIVSNSSSTRAGTKSLNQKMGSYS